MKNNTYKLDTELKLVWGTAVIANLRPIRNAIGSVVR